VALWGTHAAALGLGRLNVQSALGETLRAEVEVTSITPEEASSLKLRIAPPEAYRAAGVEYNAVLSGANVTLARRADGRQVLRVSSDRAVLEPFVDVIVEATWSSGRLVREYTMLFDPPSARVAAAPPPTAAPVMTPAPDPSPAPSAAAPAPRPSRPEPAPRVSTPATAAPAPSFSGDEYRVRGGDTLSRIAGRTQRPGVSLDQMLVSLFRANPSAFVGDNMNRLKAGTVLTVPSAEEAGKVTPQAAKELIQAQSADFGAYRQRLASGAAPAVADAPARQAAGKVQTQVDDRKAAAAPTPDRLTLSQGGVKPGTEAKDSKATEKKDSNTRLAELSRNVDELKKLQGAATTPAAPAAPAPAPAPATPAAPAPAAVAPPAAAPAPAPAPVAAAPAPTPAPTLAPTLPVGAPPAPPVAAAPAPTPPAPPPPAPTPAPKPAAAAPAEPGLLDSLSENSLLLPAAGVLVALLGGLGLYRLRSQLALHVLPPRPHKPAGETSFLESRLQPDSFFGASGGQRIDTREGAASTTGNSSSMSYSLSQLDAIGDVDPVAEADVYLAYGRDLQAEEILKEAMRANPERMAIRSKLLEVYAKRRDAKGFELLASQMFNLTRGEGEDWVKAQELGRTIDPDNTLYQPGGAPEEVRGSSGQVVEPLGASTVPYTAPAPAPSFEPAADATLDGLDLDIDIPLAGDVPPTESTQPIPAGVGLRSDDTLTLDMAGDNQKTVPVKRPATADLEPIATTIALPKETKKPAVDDGLDFDLGDLGTPAPAQAHSGDTSILDFGDFSLPQQTPPAATGNGDLSGDDNPLARKLELAEEFRQIGDLEGARDLLEEVVSKADGTLKSKAQGMLDKLG
jgi:pilus assembly protein FimV